MSGPHADICILCIGAVQPECLCLFSMEVCTGKIKMTVTSTYIECASGKLCHLIELGESFLHVDIELLQRPQVAVYERSFEHPVLLLFHCLYF